MQGEAQGSLVVRRGGIIYLVNLVNPNKAGSKAGRGSRGEERGQVRAPRRRNDGRSRRAGANGFSTPLEGIGALATAEIPTAGVFALVNSGLMGVLWSLRGCRPGGKPLASLSLLQPEREQLLLISGAVIAVAFPSIHQYQYHGYHHIIIRNSSSDCVDDNRLSPPPHG